jgi:Rap1a immunity proteins
MRRGRWIPALVLGLALTTTTARAALTEDSFLLHSTGDLVDLCTAAQSDRLYTAAVNFCHGFGLGVFRVLQEQDTARRTSHMFCLPDPAPTRNESIASFLQWAKADARRLEAPAADGIAMFLSQQYPCPRRR